jgi:hypothetical protein
VSNKQQRETGPVLGYSAAEAKRCVSGNRSLICSRKCFSVRKSSAEIKPYANRWLRILDWL